MTTDEVKRRIEPVLRRYPVQKAILFGSRARNDGSESSDVDLVIDSDGKLFNRKIFALAGELLSVLPVRVDVYDILELSKTSRLYENIKKEGDVVYGRYRILSGCER